MEDKYRGLGRNIHLDTICGNKFYRKEMTAIKYIQAMKILEAMRKYREQKLARQNPQKIESSVLSPEPKAEVYEAQEEGGDKQSQGAQYLGGEAEP